MPISGPVVWELRSHLPALMAGAEVKCAEAVEKTARDIQAEAAVRSRVRYGIMKAGWTAEAEGPFEWIVYNPVEYTIYNEYPTDRRPAQPMLTPAVENAREPFEKAMSQLYVP